MAFRIVKQNDDPIQYWYGVRDCRPMFEVDHSRKIRRKCGIIRLFDEENGVMRTKLFCLFAVASTTIFATDEKAAATTRLTQSAEIVKEIAGASDKGIPKDLFRKAVCAVVVPNVKKGGFIVGAKYGRGFASCRVRGAWSAPSGVKIEGGSFGLLIGGAETDVILLVRNESGMKHLLASKFTLGGDATAAAGPMGRDAAAQTDATMKAEILSWSRARGIYAGVSLDGSTLRPDADTNQALYGPGAQPPAILTGRTHTPAAAHALLSELKQFGGTTMPK
jgi:SH3 domain-containing YSC84-like protein 1